MSDSIYLENSNWKIMAKRDVKIGYDASFCYKCISIN